MKFKNPLKGLLRRRVRLPHQQVMAILNEAGVMVCSQSATGAFQSRQVSVPPDWASRARQVPGGAGRPWFMSFTIRLEEKDDALWLGIEPNEGVAASEVEVHRGPRRETDVLLAGIRQQWLDAHQGGPWHSQVMHASVRGGMSMHALTAATPAAMPAGRSFVQPKPWRRYALIGLAAVAVFGGGAFGMRLYLKPGGPGLDLSSMSVEDVSRLDSNPVAVRNLQDQLMSAMTTGQDAGKKLAGRIEQDHVEALTAMGLKTGASLQNAISCLNSK